METNNNILMQRATIESEIRALEAERKDLINEKWMGGGIGLFFFIFISFGVGLLLMIFYGIKKKNRLEFIDQEIAARRATLSALGAPQAVATVAA